MHSLNWFVSEIKGHTEVNGLYASTPLHMNDKPTSKQERKVMNSYSDDTKLQIQSDVDNRTLLLKTGRDGLDEVMLAGRLYKNGRLTLEST